MTMDDATKLKIIIIIKNIHQVLGHIYNILSMLDDVCNKKDSYITQHKTHLINYIKTLDNTILEWHCSIMTIQNFIDNSTFEFRLFEKINNYYFHDDKMRRKYKSDVHESIKQFGILVFNLTSTLFLHTNVAFAY